MKSTSLNFLRAGSYCQMQLAYQQIKRPSIIPALCLIAQAFLKQPTPHDHILPCQDSRPAAMAWDRWGTGMMDAHNWQFPGTFGVQSESINKCPHFRWLDTISPNGLHLGCWCQVRVPAEWPSRVGKNQNEESMRKVSTCVPLNFLTSSL